jgi:transposase
MKPPRPYPTDVSDEEWAFAAPYLTLMDPQARQRKYELRLMFNALRWMARAGAPWRLIPHEFPPWEAVYQQTQRWLQAGCFEAMVNDVRSVLRVAQGKQGQPSAVILDGRTLQSTCESGPRAGYDGYKRKKGSKVHMAVDTLGHLLAVQVMPANEQERAQVRSLAQEIQHVAGETVKLAFVDQGYTGKAPAEAAQEAGIELHVVKLPGPRRASCYCRAAGWWSAALAGSIGSGAWRATTSVCQKHSPACTLSSSPSSCSVMRPPSFKVHNTL